MGYKIARFLLRMLLRLLTRVRAEGGEYLPASGAFIVAANHIGRLDAALVYDLLDRRDVFMLVAEKYKKVALFRWLVRQFDAIFVDRFNADLGATRATLKRLKEGWVLVMAPEGTRSKTGVLQTGWDGAGYLAARSGAPVLPVAVVGTRDEDVVKALLRLKRVNILVKVGPPFTLPPLPAKEREAALMSFTDEIMCRIAALLPPEVRGVYAQHPCLQEVVGREAFQDATAHPSL